MENYKVGEVVTYIPLNQLVTVSHSNILTGQNRSTDALTISLKNGDLRTVPVALQDKVLTRNPPVVRPRVLTAAKLK